MGKTAKESAFRNISYILIRRKVWCLGGWLTTGTNGLISESGLLVMPEHIGIINTFKNHNYEIQCINNWTGI